MKLLRIEDYDSAAAYMVDNAKEFIQTRRGVATYEQWLAIANSETTEEMHFKIKVLEMARKN